MGIQVEFNPDLALRNYSEFEKGNRKEEECIPKELEAGKIYNFLKKGQRNYWLFDEIPLRETKGNQLLGKPVASVIILEADHFLENKEIFTKGKYKIVDIFNPNDNIPKFDGLDRIKENYEHIKKKIRTIPHWPKQGVMFRDITTLLKDPQGFSDVLEAFYQRYKDKKIDVVAAIESRGFIVGGALAHKLNVGFVPLRKPGKLPAETVKEEYELEYGKDAIEIHKDAILPGQNVLLIDDLIATGGTCAAAIRLIEKLQGKIVECAFVVELPELKGREKIKDYPFFKLIEFEGE